MSGADDIPAFLRREPKPQTALDRLPVFGEAPQLTPKKRGKVTVLKPGVSDREEWAARIRSAWQAGVESIIETGRQIAAAKEALEHGEFEAMVESDLPFGTSTARMLMAVARDGRFCDHGNVLPPHWRTLYELTKLDNEAFQARIADGTINPGMERKDLAAIRFNRAEERTAKIAFDAAALGTFALLYADPPWRYENPPMGGGNRSIENHYPTMELAEICALPVADIAHEHSILFLWATAPKLAECFEVITAWGFTYRTNMVWVKDQIGMGYHARNRHELLLIAKRGELPPPDVENRPDSVFQSPRTEHSAKPLEYYALLERMYPDIPKIELFCRGAPQAGWAAWGNQAEAA